MCVHEVTLSIDDRVLAEARRIAEARGVSLNQMVCEYLHELSRMEDVESIVRELDAMGSERTCRSQGPWTREAAHERS